MLIENVDKIDDDVHIHRRCFSMVYYKTSRSWNSEFKSLDFCKEAALDDILIQIAIYIASWDVVNVWFFTGIITCYTEKVFLIL
jgi:hypothetical protein